MTEISGPPPAATPPRDGHGAERLLIVLGALAGLGAVGMAAAASHALPARLDPAAMAAVGSAVQMQGWHALALLACALWSPQGGALARAAGAAFALGTALFCGAIYLRTLAGLSIGPAAPAGGVLLMLGWALLGLSAIRYRNW